VLEWLATTQYAMWVNQSWGWPVALTVHAFGTATVVGLTSIIGLRLLGVFRTIPYTTLSKLIPIVWLGIVLQVLSGVTLWLTKPAQYLADGMFVVKLALLVIGVIVTVYFQRILKREASTWEAGKASPRGVRFAAATCVLWAAVTIGGRLTAYLGSLYPT
jgi:uncharacterized membrane protein